MLFKIVLFVFQFTIFNKQFNTGNAKALFGQNVNPVIHNEFNFVVSVSEKKPNANSTHKCTGTLITHQDILTAATCLEYKSLQKIEIIIGAADLRSGRTYRPYWWILYNEWAFQMQVELIFSENDVAIIRLNEQVADNINPVTVRNMVDNELFGVMVATAGWSSDEEGDFNTILQSANLHLISKAECNSRLQMITGQHILTDLRSMCTVSIPCVRLQLGDKGGPLLYENEIIAINIGSYPQVHSINDDYKINFHTGLDFYKIFITHILEYF